MAGKIGDSVSFFVMYGKKRPQDVPRVELQQHLKLLEKASLMGLNSRHITVLAKRVIFTKLFNIHVRRRLLNCLVPIGTDFPFHVVSLAVSDATVVPISLVWQHAVLTWLSGLLEYGILPPSNSDVRVCYASIFNLAAHLHLCGLVCKILMLLTIREDVTNYRARILMKLKNKLGFFVPISQILRIYQLFRPDLVAGELSDRRVTTGCPKAFREALLAARERQQEALGTDWKMLKGDKIWLESTRVERLNVYQRNTAILQPQTYNYTTTLEEKKRKIIYVTQYRNFKNVVKGLEEHQHWQWPSNPASHLAYPLVVPLFRPHDLQLLVTLTNWLEIALKTEVTTNLGSMSEERRGGLVEAALELCRVTAQPRPLPVLNHFINEYMSSSWDHRTGNSQMLRLLEYVSYTSPEFLSETLLKVVAQMSTSRLPLMSWCHLMAAITATAATWCLVAQQEVSKRECVVQPQELFHEKCVVGVWYLTRHLQSTFKLAVLTYDANPLCLHYILDYYDKVNNWCETLGVPLVFFPPVLLTVAIIVSTDLTTTHRLGLLLASMRKGHKRLKGLEIADVSIEDLKNEQLEALIGVNSAVFLFLKALLKGKALTRMWEEELGQFYPFQFLEGVKDKKDASKYLSITKAFSYIPYYAALMYDRTEGEDIQDDEMRVNVTTQLRQAGLTGIEECLLEYEMH